MNIAEAIADTPVYVWVLVATAFAVWAKVYPMYRRKLKLEREEGERTGENRIRMNNRLAAIEGSITEQVDGSKKRVEKIECLQKSVDQLHKDHGDVSKRLGAIEDHIKKRNGFEERIMAKIEEALKR